jgi:hypothetical protein
MVGAGAWSITRVFGRGVSDVGGGWWVGVVRSLDGGDGVDEADAASSVGESESESVADGVVRGTISYNDHTSRGP